MIEEATQDKRVIWWLLQWIRGEMDKKPSPKKITFHINYFSKDKNVPNPEEQHRALTKLSHYYGIEAITSDAELSTYILGEQDYELLIPQPRFDQVYLEYADLFGNAKKRSEVIQSLEANLSSEKIKEEPNLLSINLDRQYKSFINLDDASFYRGIADYVLTIFQSSILSKLIKDHVLVQEKQITDRLHELESKCKNEIDQTAIKITELIAHKRIQFRQLKKEIDNYNYIKLGVGIHPLNSQIEEYNALCSIIKTLAEAGYTNIAEKFAILYPNKSIRKYLFSSTSPLLEEELLKFEETQKNTIWGSWRELELVYIVIQDKRSFYNAIHSSNDLISKFTFDALVNEMNQIIERKSPNNQKQFIKQDYVYHITRVHNYLSDKLLSMQSPRKGIIQEEKFITNRDVGRKLRDTIKTLKIKNKGRKLLELLKSRKPQLITFLRTETRSSDLKTLKYFCQVPLFSRTLSTNCSLN